MERIYVSGKFLKTAHYFFFAMSIFSLTSAVAFWDSFMKESVIFIAFCAIYSLASLYIAYLFYRDYRQELSSIMVVRGYMPPYMGMAIAVVLMTSLLAFLIPSAAGLIYSILFINYYYLFIIAIGAGLVALKPVRRLFEFQSKVALSGGLKIAREMSRLPDLKGYRTGTNRDVDDLLEEIWGSKKYPVPHIQRLEIEMCKMRIQELESRIAFSASQQQAGMLEREKKRYMKMLENIKDYEY